MGSPQADQEDGALVLWAQWVRAGVLAQLTPLEAKVAMVLVAFASRERNAFPAASRIAQLVGSRRTRVYGPLDRLVALKVFERTGYVKRASHNSRGPAIYRLLHPPMCTTNRDVVPAIGTPDTSMCPSQGDGVVPPNGTGVVPPNGTGVVPPNGTGVVPPNGTQIGLSDRYPEGHKDLDGTPQKETKETGAWNVGNNGGNGSGRLERVRTILASGGVSQARLLGYAENLIEEVLAENVGVEISR